MMYYGSNAFDGWVDQTHNSPHVLVIRNPIFIFPVSDIFKLPSCHRPFRTEAMQFAPALMNNSARLNLCVCLVLALNSNIFELEHHRTFGAVVKKETSLILQET